MVPLFSISLQPFFSAMDVMVCSTSSNRFSVNAGVQKIPSTPLYNFDPVLYPPKKKGENTAMGYGSNLNTLVFRSK